MIIGEFNFLMILNFYSKLTLPTKSIQFTKQVSVVGFFSCSLIGMGKKILIYKKSTSNLKNLEAVPVSSCYN